jgi:hypothetical protein
MGNLDKPLETEVHKADGTSWVLVKLIDNPQKPMALAVNTSDGIFCGFEVHLLQRQLARLRYVADKQGNRKPIQTYNKLRWRTNEEFGKKAWLFVDLPTIYLHFPQFKVFNNEICNKVAEIKDKLALLR